MCSCNIITRRHFRKHGQHNKVIIQLYCNSIHGIHLALVSGYRCIYPLCWRNLPTAATMRKKKKNLLVRRRRLVSLHPSLRTLFGIRSNNWLSSVEPRRDFKRFTFQTLLCADASGVFLKHWGKSIIKLLTYLCMSAQCIHCYTPLSHILVMCWYDGVVLNPFIIYF